MTASNDSTISVQVSLDAAPVGRAGFGTAIIVDAASMAERVRYYTSASAAAGDQVAGEITSAQLTHIQAAFAQTPRPARVGAGRGSVTDVAQVNTITVGGTPSAAAYTITINNVAFAYTADGSDTNDDIATALRTAINGGSEPVTASGAAAAIIITADVAGTPFDVGALVAPVGATLTNVATTANQSIATELQAILDESNAWYAFGIVSRADKDVRRAAQWVESANRLFMAQSSAAANLTTAGNGIFDDLDAAGYERTIPLYYAVDATPAAFAWLAKTLSADIDREQTIWYDKTLSGIAISSISETQYTNLQAKNANAYTTLLGNGATGPGVNSAGRFIDEITTLDWCVARVTENIAQARLSYSNRNSKIPYDNSGFALIDGIIAAVLEQGITAKHFTRLADGSSPFTRFTPRAESTTQDVASRTSRHEFGALLASAVRGVSVSGVITNDILTLQLLAGVA